LGRISEALTIPDPLREPCRLLSIVFSFTQV
jgi:hypothetical protein